MKSIMMKQAVKLKAMLGGTNKKTYEDNHAVQWIISNRT